MNHASSNPFQSNGRIICTLCNDPEADYPNTDAGRDRLKEHAEEEHNGQVDYVVRT